MGNAVAPAHAAPSAPINPLLSSTSELDPALTVADIPPSSPPIDSSAIDVGPASQVNDLTPQQLLFYAADAGDCDLIRRAIDRGAKVSGPDLGLKAQEEEKRVEEEKSGKVQRSGKDSGGLYKDLIVTHDSALHKAAARGHLPAVELLMELEADVEGRNLIGSTPLHRAVSAKQGPTVQLLITKGAQIDAVNNIGNTPLHVASYQGDVDTAQVLLSHSRPDAYRLVVTVNEAGLTPIDYARKKAMHQLLTAHRLPSSHHASFTEHAHTPHGDLTTPKHGSLGFHAHEDALSPVGHGDRSERGERPERLLPHQASGEGGGLSSRALHHHHHIAHAHSPNPPISATSSQSTSRSATSHTLNSSHSSEHHPSSHALLTLPSTAASTPSTMTHPPQPSSSISADPHSASTPILMPTLASKPSFGKLPSLDSHPTDEGPHSMALDSVVEPIMDVAGDGKGRAVSAANLDILKVKLLPNECDRGEEEEKEGAFVTEGSARGR